MRDTTNTEILRDKVVTFLEKLGIDVTYKRFTTDNVMIRCPFAGVSGHSKEVDKNPSLGLKITNNGFVYNCFTCHRKGHSLIDFVKRMQDEGVITKSISAHELQNSIAVEFPGYDEKFVLNKKKKVAVVEEHVEKHPITKLFRDYVINERGLDEDIIKKLNLWYNPITQKVLFPCFSDGEYVGSIYHSVVGAWPKYSNDFDVGKYLYLEWLVKGKKGIIVEGMFDACVVYKHLRDLKLLEEYSVVGAFGAEITYEQVMKMIAYFDLIIVAGDNDIGGIEMERDIFRIGRKKLPAIYRMRYSAGDPAELSLKTFKTALEHNISGIKSYHNFDEIY